MQCAWHGVTIEAQAQADSSWAGFLVEHTCFVAASMCGWFRSARNVCYANVFRDGNYGLYIGLARTIYIRCIYGIFGSGITKYTVIYGVYIRFWPTLLIHTECRIKIKSKNMDGRNIANIYSKQYRSHPAGQKTKTFAGCYPKGVVSGTWGASVVHGFYRVRLFVSKLPCWIFFRKHEAHLALASITCFTLM